MAIGSNTTTLSFDDAVSSFLLEEMRWKNMEGHTQMHYLQEDAPRIEIYLSPQVRDLSLRVDLNLLEIL